MIRPRRHHFVLLVNVATLAVTTHSFVIQKPLAFITNDLTTSSPHRMVSGPDLEERKRQISAPKGSLKDPNSMEATQESLSASSQSSKEEDGEKSEMSLVTARAILLLVAAIWGTNFAVRVLAKAYYWDSCFRQTILANVGLCLLISLKLFCLTCLSLDYSL